MAQLLLQQGRVNEALKYFERAATLSRTEGEIVNALSYAEATRTQLEVGTNPVLSWAPAVFAPSCASAMMNLNHTHMT